ncbi:Hypothetical protein NTJ_09707 [Nesidiocoris tenuis]|uniref:Uncharacterized protein n=1 Tax=Nesidiocoris tenuis TaxID=355587 RepID=A0ABN7AXI4_9HEMI|nr:Hypothetical protein NTJ_09707 [Nesidiocoris tenuis]
MQVAPATSSAPEDSTPETHPRTSQRLFVATPERATARDVPPPAATASPCWTGSVDILVLDGFVVEANAEEAQAY